MEEGAGRTTGARHWAVPSRRPAQKQQQQRRRASGPSVSLTAVSTARNMALGATRGQPLQQAGLLGRHLDKGRPGSGRRRPQRDHRDSPQRRVGSDLRRGAEHSPPVRARAGVRLSLAGRRRRMLFPCLSPAAGGGGRGAGPVARSGEDRAQKRSLRGAVRVRRVSAVAESERYALGRAAQLRNS